MTQAQELIRKETAKAKARKDSATEENGRRTLENQLVALDLPIPEWGVAFQRRWEFDGAYPDRRIAIEVEGRGRHTQMYGRKRKDGSREAISPFEKDCEKYNTAAILGWCVLRFTYPMIYDGRAVRTIYLALPGAVPCK